MSASLGENIRHKFNNGRFVLEQLDFDWHNWQLPFTSMYHSPLFMAWDLFAVGTAKMLWNRAVINIWTVLDYGGYLVLHAFIIISTMTGPQKSRNTFETIVSCAATWSLIIIHDICLFINVNKLNLIRQ